MFVSRSFETKTGLLKNVKCIDGDHTPFIIMADWNAHYDLIMSYVPNKKTVIQAGGNCGLYARLYATVFDSVFTFEPDPINFSCLAENCKINKIVKFNTALANKNGMLNMKSKNIIYLCLQKVMAKQIVKINMIFLHQLIINYFSEVVQLLEL